MDLYPLYLCTIRQSDLIPLIHAFILRWISREEIIEELFLEMSS